MEPELIKIKQAFLVTINSARFKLEESESTFSLFVKSNQRPLNQKLGSKKRDQFDDDEDEDEEDGSEEEEEDDKGQARGASNAPTGQFKVSKRETFP